MKYKQSPNYYRTPKNKPQYFIVHITEGSYNGAVSWLTSTRSRASAHYVVSRKGDVTQLVREEYGAWHSGFKNWNLKSIGVEHEGFCNKSDKWTKAMLNTTSKLLADAHKRWGIPLDRSHVLGHTEVKKSKPCPCHLMDGLDQLISLAKGKINNNDDMYKEKYEEKVKELQKVLGYKKELQDLIDKTNKKVVELRKDIKYKDELIGAQSKKIDELVKLGEQDMVNEIGDKVEQNNSMLKWIKNLLSKLFKHEK